MRLVLASLAALLLLAACGEQTELTTIDDFRARLDANRCRAVLDKASYDLMSWEYDNDQRVVTDELLRTALPDSLLVCPVSAERYVLEIDDDERTLSCPAGHGSILLMEE